MDKNDTWTYVNKNGIAVKYVNGYPDFTKYIHPDVPPVKIKVAVPTNRLADYKAANIAAGLNKNSTPPIIDMYKPPTGYTWHHLEDGETMILVKKEIHSEFTHIGGESKINGKLKGE